MEMHERRSGIVGPVILIGAGIIFLMTNLGMLNWTIWETLFRLWPVLLIAIGLDILIGRRSMLGSLLIVVLLFGVLGAAILVSASGTPLSGQALTSETVSQPLDGATRADVEISPGVAELRIDAASESADLVQGTVAFGRGERITADHSKSGDTMHFTLHNDGVPSIWWPGAGSWHNKIWDLKLSRDVPIQLKLNGGVGQSTVDLSHLKVTQLDVNTGVGQSTITLPRMGQVEATIDAGVGEVTVIIPAGMPARIRVSGGLGQTDVNGNFQRNGDEYVSPGYDSATDRVNLQISGGIGRVTVREVAEG